MIACRCQNKNTMPSHSCRMQTKSCHTSFVQLINLLLIYRRVLWMWCEIMDCFVLVNTHVDSSLIISWIESRQFIRPICGMRRRRSEYIEIIWCCAQSGRIQLTILIAVILDFSMATRRLCLPWLALAWHREPELSPKMMNWKVSVGKFA